MSLKCIGMGGEFPESQHAENSDCQIDDGENIDFKRSIPTTIRMHPRQVVIDSQVRHQNTAEAPYG